MLPASSTGFSPMRLQQDCSTKQFHNLTTKVQESLYCSDPNEDTNDFDYDSLEDDSIDALYSSSEENEEYDSGQKARSTRVPFWFSFEESGHIESIVKAYAQQLNLDQERPLGGNCRRLPNFVGRIQRQPVCTDNEFTTLDVVQIYRRDIRPVGSTVSLMEEKSLVTTWDDDGVPESFDELQDRDDIDFWEQRIIFESSFIYCMPVWCSCVEYNYEVTAEQKEVGYAKEPFNFTKYIPLHYLPPIMDLNCGWVYQPSYVSLARIEQGK